MCIIMYVGMYNTHGKLLGCPVTLCLVIHILLSIAWIIGWKESTDTQIQTYSLNLHMYRYKQPLTICFFSKLLTLVKSLPRSSDDNWSSTSLIHCSTSSAACINCCCCLTSLNFWPLSFVLYNEHHQWFYRLLNRFIHMVVYKGLCNYGRNY